MKQKNLKPLPPTSDTKFWNVDDDNKADKVQVDLSTITAISPSDSDEYILNRQERTIYCVDTGMGFKFSPHEIRVEESYITVIRGRNFGKKYRIGQII